jgi:hypothetical protein
MQMAYKPTEFRVLELAARQREQEGVRLQAEQHRQEQRQRRKAQA